MITIIRMIYRNFYGKLVHIEKKDYHTDSSYYEKIISTIFNVKLNPNENTLNIVSKMLKDNQHK